MQTLTGREFDELNKKIGFEDILKGLQKRKEIKMFYSDLCNYVHLSEQSQPDALRDNLLNVTLQLPEYEKDLKLLQKHLNILSISLLRV